MKKLILILVITAGCMSKSQDDIKKEYLMQTLILNKTSFASASSGVSSGSSCTSNFSCASSPSFSTLSAAGTTAKCATSGCHTSAAQQSGLNITDYNSTKAFTNPGNPCSSRLYTAISVGSMAGNSDSAINQAVYCWIAGGSNP